MSFPNAALPARLALLAVVAAAPAAAATRVWPALIGPGCNATLQQCVNDADAGDTVRIVADDLLLPDAYTAIDEDLLIGKSLTLEAAPGIDAVFAPGREVFVDSPTTGTVSVTLRRLVLRAGGVQVRHRNFGPGSYVLDQVRVDDTEGTACAIDLQDRGEGEASFVVGDSTLRFHQPRSARPSGICANGNGGAWQVAMFRNRIEADPGTLFAGITISGTSAGDVTLGGNQLFVYGALRGISVSQNPGSSANVLSIHDNLITGQFSVPAAAEYALSVGPTNTDLRIANNTIARNGKGIGIGFRDGDSSFGRVANNLVAYNAIGVSIDARHTMIAADRNLVSGNGADFFVPGIGTIGLDPQFESMHDFRLRAASPARDAGGDADVPTLFGVAFDADGERRIVGGGVDIGAFEWSGDRSIRHLATSADTVGNTTRFDGLQAVGASERVMLTPLRGAATGAEAAETLGVFQDFDGSANYYGFHEDLLVDLSPGRRFHALAPAGGVTGFLHTTTSASVVDSYSRISHPELDARPGAIAFVVHNWNPGGGAGLYHDHRLGLDYVAPNWFVGNQDRAEMLSGRAFNLVVAPLGSPNAFVREVGGSARAELRLEHPLLDDNACATLQVGRNGSTANDVAYSLDYRAGAAGAPGHWFIVAEGAGSPAFPADTAFNVLVAGAQANGCRAPRVFADGFE